MVMVDPREHVSSAVLYAGEAGGEQEKRGRRLSRGVRKGGCRRSRR